MLPSEYEIYLAVGGSILLLLALLSAFVISINTSRKRKLKLEKEIIETHYRTREHTLMQVSRDLHDDIGASLSGINLFNQLLQQQIEAGENKNAAVMSEKINFYIDDIVTKVADMTWLFKPGNNTVQCLADKIQAYVADIAGTKNIHFFIETAPAAAEKTLSLLQQKNSYLICKEAANNAVKYADCSTLGISIQCRDEQLVISVKDNGKGFNNGAVSNGNGLKNQRSRAKEMSGCCTVQSGPDKGVLVELSFPIAIISHNT